MTKKHQKMQILSIRKGGKKLSRYEYKNLQMGNKLSSLRIKSGYSLTEFAELIHTTCDHLAQVECGKIRASYKLLCEIAYNLNMNADELTRYCSCENGLNINLLSYGEKIKYYRKEENLTQKALGSRVGLSTSEIYLLECEERYPEYEEMERIARALNRKTCDFYSIK